MIRQAWAWLTSEPSYPPTPGDERTAVVAGLRLPVRASVALAVTTFVLLFDYSRTFIPDDIAALGRTPSAQWVTAIERAVLFGLVPMLVIVLAFRDRPSRYGLRLGNARTGALLTIAGCLVMTPIVLWIAALPDVRAYYAPSATDLAQLVVTNLIDLTATEFLFRGFLMFALIRVMGPFGVLVATMPFVFAHLGKPELELFSTLGGGLIYGWLAWRTGSIVWGALGPPTS